MARADAYAGASHPDLAASEVQARTAWLYSQCAENDAAEDIAEEHGSMAPALFPNTAKDRHAHPLHCMALGDDRFGMHTQHNSSNPPEDLEGPGGSAALNIPGEFMYAWIDGKARLLIRYVVWTVDDRDGNPLTPVKINQHPTYNSTAQMTVAELNFSQAYKPRSVWVEMPDTITLANLVTDRILPGRSFATRAWMDSHCHDKRYKTNIPQMVIDRAKQLGWLDGSANPRSARAIRFVSDGNPNLASSWSLTEVSVTLPSQVNSYGIYRWFNDAGVEYSESDEIRPTRPIALTAEPRTSTRIMLRWDEASDNLGVVGYEIYRDNSRVGYSTALWFRDEGLAPLTEYTYKVFAVDAAGNVSPRSRIVRATTLADELAPGRPKNVTLAATTNSITVNWDPAFDNAGIDHYVIRSSGEVIARPRNTRYVMQGLDPGTRYHVSVQAVDTSGNGGPKVHNWKRTMAGTTTYSPILGGQVWRYLDNGSNQGGAWKARSFDDSSWDSGTGEFGYGDGDESTVVDDGPSGNRFVTTYFRTDFDIADAAAVQTLRLRLVRDDGAVVYINGVEVYRSNMPSGAVEFDTLARNGISGHGESNWINVFLPVGALRTGNNVMAVEIHQNHRTSSDISFNARLRVNP